MEFIGLRNFIWLMILPGSSKDVLINQGAGSAPNPSSSKDSVNKIESAGAGVFSG